MKRLCGVLILLCSLGLHAQTQDIFRLGQIENFGAWGEDLSRVKQALPLHVGDVVKPDQAADLRAKIQASTVISYGAAATDVTFVCCDSPQTITLYIGLPGDSYRPTASVKPLNRGPALPTEAQSLYGRYGTAWEKAVEAGRSIEDDSHGYALTEDANLRAIQLAMRRYAVRHPAELMRVLQSNANVEQRRAAAALLGYARRSSMQLNALAMAANDVDDDVRNNSLRALEVLAHAGTLEGVDLSPIAGLLSSGTWSDRNKASLLLMYATFDRDPRLMVQLRREELRALLDGAVWTSAGHADPFLTVLGRVEGLSEDEIGQKIKSDAGKSIIAAAKVAAQDGYTHDRHE